MHTIPTESISEQRKVRQSFVDESKKWGREFVLASFEVPLCIRISNPSRNVLPRHTVEERRPAKVSIRLKSRENEFQVQ